MNKIENSFKLAKSDDLSLSISNKSGSIFSEEQNEVVQVVEINIKTLRQYLDKFLTDGNKKQTIETVSVLFAVSTFLIYIISTYYKENDFYWFNYLDMVVCFYFNVEILLSIYLAQHRLLYLKQSENLIDIFSSVVPYLYSFEIVLIKKIIELARIFRIIKVTKYISKYLRSNSNEVAKHLTIMILSTLTLILIFTLVFRIVEIDKINDYIKNAELNEIRLKSNNQFHDFLYFIVVTLSTVGYGDIFPLTELGRLVIVLLILIALILIPMQTNELIKLMSTSSVYARTSYKSNPEVPHIVICGHVSTDALKNFCYELFHPDHGTQDKNAVIIQNTLPAQEMKVFLHAGIYEVSLKYLQGNPIYEKILQRADILNSKACVIMTDKFNDDPHLVDHQNILLALSIKKYFLYHKKESQLYIQLIKPENKVHYQSGLQSLNKSNFITDQVIIIEEIKMNLLSKSCLIPGIITMISNLVMSSGWQVEELNSQWINEYSEGRGHEIYRTLLNHIYKNKTFSQLSCEIYRQYEAIVFALEIKVEGKTLISLNPGNFLIEKLVNERDDVQIYIYIICSDKSVADRVRKCT